MEASRKSFSRYFPVSGRDRKWGWHVTTVGETQTLPGDKHPAAGHPKGDHFDWSFFPVVEPDEIRSNMAIAKCRMTTFAPAMLERPKLTTHELPAPFNQTPAVARRHDNNDWQRSVAVRGGGADEIAMRRPHQSRGVGRGASAVELDSRFRPARRKPDGLPDSGGVVVG
jgi:hypothetical protein